MAFIVLVQRFLFHSISAKGLLLITSSKLAQGISSIIAFSITFIF